MTTTAPVDRPDAASVASEAEAASESRFGPLNELSRYDPPRANIDPDKNQARGSGGPCRS